MPNYALAMRIFLAALFLIPSYIGLSRQHRMTTLLNSSETNSYASRSRNRDGTVLNFSSYAKRTAIRRIRAINAKMNKMVKFAFNPEGSYSGVPRYVRKHKKEAYRKRYDYKSLSTKLIKAEKCLKNASSAHDLNYCHTNIKQALNYHSNIIYRTGIR